MARQNSDDGMRPANPVQFGLKEDGVKQALFRRVFGKAMLIYLYSSESYQCK
jgi:hypothetical protein